MSPKLILIADKDTADRNHLRNAFETVVKDDLKVVEFMDDNDLLNHMSDLNHRNRPSLIMMDMNMPEASGFKVLQTLRKNGKVQHVPVVMFSRNSEPHLIDRAFDLGANHYVQKPDSTDEYVHIAHALNTLFLSPFPF